jgi:PAS domain-containing protein
VDSAPANRGDGDATYFSKIGTASTPSAPSEAGGPLGLMRPGAFGYFSTVSPEDYLAAPVSAPKDLLSKFPPTLLISATRALDMSPAIAFHRALTRAGADASLHLFDGLGHCFYYNAWLPESRDAYDTIIRFFDRHLRQSPAPS